MDLWDFPALSQAETPEEAAAEMEKLRQPDSAWIKETPLVCRLEDWRIEPSQRRYTITVENVPFECLYLPGKGKKLYVMLSHGGRTKTEKYPLFTRWTYREFLDGHLLCIDDPMYLNHKGYTNVLWYYGTNETSFLTLLAEIVKKAMRMLNIAATDVVHIGSSGGGYAALYLCNMLNHSSAIAMNPQFILKSWNYPVSYNHFLEWGVNLDENDRFSRNRLRLDNNTSRFFILINIKASEDYQKQFQPFAEAHGIPVRYGLSQHNNYVTWLHATDYFSPHIVNLDKAEVLAISYLLDKTRYGANVNEIHSVSLVFNEILRAKFAAQNTASQCETYHKHYFSLISQIILEEWGKLINNPAYPVFCGEQDIHLIPKIYGFWSNYYINTRQDIRYQVLYSKTYLYFRFNRRLPDLGEKKDAWLARAKENTDKTDDKLEAHMEREWFAISKPFRTENQRQTIRDFILRTMDLWRDE